MLSVTADAEFVRDLANELRKHGYEVDNVTTGDSALPRLPGANTVLLDLDIADRDGLSLCSELRMETSVPIICYTSNTAELDRVLALQAGSDDCLVVPFGWRELVVRMQAIARRRSGLGSRRQTALINDGLTIDPRSREVRICGHAVDLTRKEFDLLLLLASRPDKVVSREEIVQKVWGNGLSRPGRTIDTHVSSIRGKLGSKAWIVTVRGVGFQLGSADSVALGS
ncbi:response regulator transcription factor [Amycolatopsis pithecellobii]|uniref:Sensory transduction protein RegX3 n=1 Tax=Amycolatopsis pithecellobii TaxID=664692 RepID=A0A6N7Z569_9PSEU|nr:response regulator transcription factor [Amycolatopsis pithecellobii]MTD54536.1 response regulator [Amycolatopsis pithecellobii]